MIRENPASRGTETALILARVSSLIEKTNITQDPGQDSRWAPHSGREFSSRIGGRHVLRRQCGALDGVGVGVGGGVDGVGGVGKCP